MTNAGERLALAMVAVFLTGCAMLGIGGDRLVIDVRNDLGRPVLLEITADAMEAAGDPTRIADPISIAADHNGPVTFSSPASTWSLRVVGDEGFFDSRDLHDWADQLESGEISAFALVVQTNGQLAAETNQ
jgi:hypothetical protein